MCTKDTINASAWVTDMGYAIALKITDINFPDLVQIPLFVFVNRDLQILPARWRLTKKKLGMAQVVEKQIGSSTKLGTPF